MNALKDKLYRNITTITGHNNLLNQTKQAIEYATTELHTSQFFDRDKQSFFVDLTKLSKSCDNMYEISFGLMGNVRRIITAGMQYANNTFIVIPVVQSYIEFMRDSRLDYAVIVNNSIIFRSARPNPKAIVLESLLYPNVSDAAYSSWIAENYSSVIIEKVAYRILSDIGDKSANYHLRLYEEAYRHLVADSKLILRS